MFRVFRVLGGGGGGERLGVCALHRVPKCCHDKTTMKNLIYFCCPGLELKWRHCTTSEGDSSVHDNDAPNGNGVPTHLDEEANLDSVTFAVIQVHADFAWPHRP